MNRYIDADALIKENAYASDMWDRGTQSFDLPIVVVRDIEDAPSIDIVRCGECKWADWYKTADGKQFCYCMETGNGGRIADDFCSYGERREP